MVLPTFSLKKTPAANSGGTTKNKPILMPVQFNSYNGVGLKGTALIWLFTIQNRIDRADGDIVLSIAFYGVITVKIFHG